MDCSFSHTCHLDSGFGYVDNTSCSVLVDDKRRCQGKREKENLGNLCHTLQLEVATIVQHG